MIPLAYLLILAAATGISILLSNLGWNGAEGGTHWAVAYIGLGLAVCVWLARKERDL